MKRIIILSVGTATPKIIKALSQAFEINQELLFKILYNAPAVFLDNADETLAEKAFTILTELGLEVQIQNVNEKAPLSTESLDIAIHINDPVKLSTVNKQLSEFLGCDESESLQLLLQEPCVVLGGVSMATAESLQKRVDAEVIASNPKMDLYTIEFTAESENDRLKLINLFKNQEITIPEGETKWVRNLTYEQMNQFLTRYRSQHEVKIYNQSYSRFRILLDNFDLTNTSQTNFLVSEIGMPTEVLAEIHANLPVLLDESVNYATLQEKLATYKQAGLDCSEEQIPFGKYLLTVSNITDSGKAREILSKFYKDVSLDKITDVWKAPLPLGGTLSRLLEKQLEYIGCEIEYEY
ncbi:MAG: hypothetical protein K0S23_1937 [Fluviicola sp.]|uniref:hypothetical protein n=1 Tax=Fluviicola sp. TaxID=1917219 RepID=UPI00260C5141|nr:hypothetical protein [Fluviicola sp.]MDF3027630.1 hypothetical protein [Fluviicola sp.]